MNLLLDTHTILWFCENNEALSKKSVELISNNDNICYVSLASIWEIAIKIMLNKLNLSITLEEFINELLERDFVLLSIKTEHILKNLDLEFYHRDPFDRLLISQSIYEQMPLISKDAIFDNYISNRIWY